MEKRTLWIAAALVAALVIGVVLFRFAKSGARDYWECIGAGTTCNWGEQGDLFAPKQQPLVTLK